MNFQNNDELKSRLEFFLRTLGYEITITSESANLLTYDGLRFSDGEGKILFVNLVGKEIVINCNNIRIRESKLKNSYFLSKNQSVGQNEQSIVNEVVDSDFESAITIDSSLFHPADNCSKELNSNLDSISDKNSLFLEIENESRIEDFESHIKYQTSVQGLKDESSHTDSENEFVRNIENDEKEVKVESKEAMACNEEMKSQDEVKIKKKKESKITKMIKSWFVI